MNCRILALAVLLALGIPARAAFHLWDVTEVYSSPDGSVQFVELNTSFGGQNFLKTFNASVVSSDGTTTHSFPFPTDLGGDTTGKHLIIGTTNLASIPGGLTPDYFIPPNFIVPPGASGEASVTFVASGGFISYTNRPDDGESSWTHNGLELNSPINYSNQTNRIVPVRIDSVQAKSTNVVISFRTATGVNGSAGPNYTVEFKNLPTDPTWTPLTSVSGDGTPKVATNSTAEADQRIYRLRVP